jgi:pimeloyl-ACP methyl ester carboxylesterase
MGAKIIFTYAAIFPQRVDMIISIEGLAPVCVNASSIIRGLQRSLENFMIADQRNIEKSEPPAYTFDEMIERLHAGSGGSVTKETAPYLLKRNVVPSQKFPGKFTFARDGRLKHDIAFNFSQSILVDLSKEIKVPFLVLKASESHVKEKKEDYEEIINILRANPHFELNIIESKSHHMHLTEPEKIAECIGNFIEKHRKIQSQL